MHTHTHTAVHACLLLELRVSIILPSVHSHIYTQRQPNTHAHKHTHRTVHACLPLELPAES